MSIFRNVHYHTTSPNREPDPRGIPRRALQKIYRLPVENFSRKKPCLHFVVCYHQHMKRFLLTAATLFLTACATPDATLPELTTINQKINAYEYQAENGDHWKQPPEFYRDGGGDCEDFAIAKFYLVSAARKREILIAYDTWKRQYHAVLLVDGVYVLDNQYDDVYSLTSDRFFGRYIPIYFLDHTTKTASGK